MKFGISEEEWRDDPEAIAEWEAEVRAIEPLEFSEEERAEAARYEAEFHRYNIEAVRRHMNSDEE